MYSYYYYYYYDDDDDYYYSYYYYYYYYYCFAAQANGEIRPPSQTMRLDPPGQVSAPAL